MLLAFCSSLYCAQSVLAQSDQTASKLQSANTSVDQAFNAVLAAEKAGANVTSLLTQLNVAEGFLSQAENANRVGDSVDAANNADLVLPIAQQVTTAAQSSEHSAQVSAQNSFYSLIALAVVGPVVFLFVLYFVWGKFKTHYINSLSDAKPEVTNQ